jgi:hypothetical protein
MGSRRTVWRSRKIGDKAHYADLANEKTRDISPTRRGALRVKLSTMILGGPSPFSFLPRTGACIPESDTSR